MHLIDHTVTHATAHAAHAAQAAHATHAQHHHNIHTHHVATSHPSQNSHSDLHLHPHVPPVHTQSKMSMSVSGHRGHIVVGIGGRF
jgi:hypothetical protein